MIYFRPRGSFLANFCPIFMQSEVQSAIDRSLPTPAHQRKALGTNKVFANSWICFIKRPCLNFWFVSRVDSLLTIIGDRHWQKLAAMFKKSRITKFTPLKGAFSCGLMWGAYFCMGAYKHDVVVVMKMVPIFMRCLFCVGAYYPDFMVVYIYHVIEVHLTSPLTLLMSSPSSLFCFFFFFLPPSSLVPRLLCRGGGKRAWYTLFSHAPSSLGNHSATLKLCSQFCLPAERQYCMVILPVGHIWGWY